MKLLDKITPIGTRDRVFDECRSREAVAARLRALYESRGFGEVITPALEFYDVFAIRGGYFSQESMYKLVDSSGRLLALRPDCTVPIARLMATRLKDLRPPVRLYYHQNIYRVSKNLGERMDEINQMGLELIGAGSPASDLETIALAASSLKACGIEEFHIEICHIGYFKALIRSLGADDATGEHIRELVERKNFPALVDLLDGFPQTDAVLALRSLPALFGSEEVIARARTLFEDQEASAALDYLGFLYAGLQKLGLQKHIMLDLGIVGEADYYTGMIFHGYLPGTGETVLSGGRYDGLMGLFGNDLPSTGFGINMNLLCAHFADLFTIPKRNKTLVFAQDGDTASAIRYIEENQREGYVMELSLDPTEEETLAYAKRRGFGRVISLTAGIPARKVRNKIDETDSNCPYQGQNRERSHSPF